MNKFVKGITMLVPVLLVMSTIDVALAATKLDLVEEQTAVPTNGDTAPSIGSKQIFTSVLKDSTGMVQGRKESNCLVTRQNSNGDFIIFCIETIFIGSDNNNALFAAGEINLTGKLFESKPQKINIIGGTGKYVNAKGKETITLLPESPEPPEPRLFNDEISLTGVFVD